MKQGLFLGIAASALLFSNCSNEDLEGGKISAQGNKHVITASFEGCKDGPSTRTTVGTNNQILWTAGDAFNLFYKDESGSTRYGIISGVGTPSASFEGTVESGKTPLYAVFPSQEDMTISSNVLTMTLPSAITWSANSNGPMLAKVKDGSVDKGVYFNHLAALLKVVVSKMPEGAAAFKITSSENIAGSCTATVNADEPVLGAPAGDDAKKEIIVSFPAITQEKANSEQVFFVPLPAISYQRLTITLTNGEGSTIYFQKTRNNFTLKRADLLEAVIDKTSIDATTPSGVNTQLNDAKLEETIQNATSGNVPVNIALTEEITTSSTSEPLQLPMVDNAQLNMTFEKAPVTTTDAPLVIKEKDNSTVTGTNALTVAIPAVAADNAPSFTVDLPKTTVTLASKDDASTTYNKVIATTAEHTLVVEKGVTVKELVIKGGNVKIYGTVEKLSRHSENATESTTVEVYDAGDIRSVDGINNFAIKSVWDGKIHEEVTLPDMVNSSKPIYTASQFALLQSKNIPASVAATQLTPTVVENITLCTDIDLNHKPWIGMVLQGEKAFEGNNHTVSNLTIQKFVLDQQQTQYTPNACIGLFAAAYKNSTIKNITVKSVNITGEDAKNAKWVGALVGYSYGVKEYTNCKSEDVTIELLGTSAIRVGGLIGYIEKCHATTEPSVTLTNCSVKNAKVTASYSYSGLVGSLYDAVKFDGCTTENITLGLGNSGVYGYVSKFVGDVANAATHNRKVIFKDCTTQDLSENEKVALGFDKIAMKEGKKYVGGCKYVGIVDVVNQMTLIEEISGTSKTLVAGTDFNKYEAVSGN